MLSLTDAVFFPIFATVLSFIFLSEKAHKNFLILLCIGVTGIVIFQLNELIETDLHSVIGWTFSIVTIFLYSICLVLIKKLLDTGLLPEHVLFWRFPVFGFIGIIFIIYLIFNEELTFSNVYPLVVGFFGFGVPFYLSFILIGSMPANHYGSLIPFIPIFSWILTIIFIEVIPLTFVRMIGMIVCFFAAYKLHTSEFSKQTIRRRSI